MLLRGKVWPGPRDSFPGGVADLGDPTHRGRKNHMDMDCSLQALRSLSVHGIFQAKVLEWVAISFSNFEACLFPNT